MADSDMTEIYVLKDGEYEGSGTGYGGELKVKVVITDGKISAIEVLENNETPEFLNVAMAIIADMIRQQTADVDVISGATFSSNGIKEAVAAALAGVERVKVTVSRQEADEREKKQNEPIAEAQNKDELSKTQSTVLPTTDEGGTQAVTVIAADQQSELIDGEYEGSGQGYRGTITVRVSIRGGRLADIQLVSAEDDAAYIAKAKTVIAALLNGGGQSVDTVSGATYSSKGLIAAVNDALTKALRNKPTTDEDSGPSNSVDTANDASTVNQSNNDTKKVPQIIDRNQPDIQKMTDLADGVYEAEADSGQYFAFKGASKIRLVIKDNLITGAEIVSFADDTSYGEGSEAILVKQKITRLLTDLNGANQDQVLAVRRQIEQKQGKSYDSVSGATVSAKGIMSAVEKALQLAAAGQSVPSNDKTGSETPQNNKQQSQTKKPQPQAEKPKSRSEQPQAEEPESQSEQPQEKQPVRPEDVIITAETRVADGEYSGTAAYSRYAQTRGANVVRIEIKDGRIVKAVSETYTDDDLPLFHASRERILTSVNGKTVAEILDLYHQLENQSGVEYDAVSRATQTAKGHVSAVMEALKQAAAAWQNNDKKGND